MTLEILKIVAMALLACAAVYDGWQHRRVARAVERGNAQRTRMLARTDPSSVARMVHKQFSDLAARGASAAPPG